MERLLSEGTGAALKLLSLARLLERTHEYQGNGTFTHSQCLDLTFCYAPFMLIFLAPCNNYSCALSFTGTATEGNRGADGQELGMWALRCPQNALWSKGSDVSFQTGV